MAEFPGFAHCYLLSDPVERRAVRLAAPVGRVTALDIWRGEWLPDKPLEVAISSGTQYRDVLWSSSIIPLAVRQRVAEMFESESFTGWRIFDLDLRPTDRSPYDRYFGLSVTGRCGQLLPHPGTPDRYYFDPNCWDGSDSSRPMGQRILFVTEPVQLALKAANVRNVVLESLSVAEMPYIHE